MSYLLLDKKLAIKTNLIKNKKPKMEYIQDIYEDMLKDLKVYISNEKPTKELTEPLKRVLIKNLDRKLVKSVYMPLIYGKTLMSTVKDIIAKLSRHITRKDGFTAAQIFF
jgi:DNA-dependent RNA polymerase